MAGARSLRLAQPAVSRSVRALEEELGARLIERTTRRFALTELGARLLAESDGLFERLEELRGLATPAGPDLRGAVRFGASEAVASAIVPRAMAMLASRHRTLHPYVVVAPTRDLVLRAQASDLEGVFTFNPLRGSDLVRKTLGAFRFHLVCSATHQNDPRTTETFFGSREVEDERERHFPALLAWRSRWPKARIRGSTNSLTAQRELVESGAGVAILPEFLVHRELASGRFVRLPGVDFRIPLTLVRRRASPSPSAQAFIDAIAASAELMPGYVGASKNETPARSHRA